MCVVPSYGERIERAGCWRADEMTMKRVTEGIVVGKRPLGRPRTRWKIDPRKRAIRGCDIGAGGRKQLRQRWIVVLLLSCQDEEEEEEKVFKVEKKSKSCWIPSSYCE